MGVSTYPSASHLSAFLFFLLPHVLRIWWLFCALGLLLPTPFLATSVSFFFLHCTRHEFVLGTFSNLWKRLLKASCQMFSCLVTRRTSCQVYVQRIRKTVQSPLFSGLGSISSPALLCLRSPHRHREEPQPSRSIEGEGRSSAHLARPQEAPRGGADLYREVWPFAEQQRLTSHCMLVRWFEILSVFLLLYDLSHILISLPSIFQETQNLRLKD